MTRVAAALVILIGLLSLPMGAAGRAAPADPAAVFATATPIKHFVVIFDENISFDHYFATYPVAANPPGEPAFHAAPDTPSVNGLSGALLTHNPNGKVQPKRLDRQQALTCDQTHWYDVEQRAYDQGLLDKFVIETEGIANPLKSWLYCPVGIVLDYFDGNTITALWNYAQHFALSDNTFGTTFGPSVVGALNLVAGQTAPALCGPPSGVYGNVPLCAGSPASPSAGSDTGTVYADPDPYFDDCSKGGPSDKSATAIMAGRNIGDLLNAAHITWGWFNGGFDDCADTHPPVAYDRLKGIDPATDPHGVTDYSPGVNPFQYYASTSNPHHLRPSSSAKIGQTDQANHLYDLNDFWTAAGAGNLPAVSFLKPPRYEDGHAGYSDPLDEQAFLVNTLNRLQQLPEWSSTAVVITYDDSDGWYDHVLGPIVNLSATNLDDGCGTTNDGPPARCGYGPRLPLLVISPYAKANEVDHTVLDQTSVLRFIEDNWLGGQRISNQSFDRLAGSLTGMFDFTHPRQEPPLLLDPVTGEPQPATPATPVAWQDAGAGIPAVGDLPRAGWRT